MVASEVFWLSQGVLKETSGMKWVNSLLVFKFFSETDTKNCCLKIVFPRLLKYDEWKTYTFSKILEKYALRVHF